MNIRTTALAALLALAAPTAAQADFWSDFFGDADEDRNEEVAFGLLGRLAHGRRVLSPSWLQLSPASRR